MNNKQRFIESGRSMGGLILENESRGGHLPLGRMGARQKLEREGK